MVPGPQADDGCPAAERTGAEAFRRLLPLVEAFPLDAEEAIACAEGGPCAGRTPNGGPDGP